MNAYPHIAGYDRKLTNSKPVLIAFSHICGADFITGAEKLLLFMLRELQNSYECRLVVPEEGILARKARKSGIQVIHMPIPITSALYLAGPSSWQESEALKHHPAWPATISLLQVHCPQLVLVNTCVHPLPAMAAKALGIPRIWAVMETIMETEHTAHSAAFIHQHADWIVGISSTTLRPFHHAGLDDKTTILFPSWDREDYQPRAWVENRAGKRAELGFHDGQRVIGYVAASIYRNKGFEHFMNMALQIGQRFPKAVFAVIGHPVDREYVEETFDLARAAGMMDRFRRIHFEQNIQSVYPAFDILVVPSLMPEGFGMTALEGMLFGKAVVAYDSGGLGEILNLTGNKKFLVPTGEVDGLIKKVARLLDDEKLLVQTGMRNSYNAQAVFGIAAYRKRLSHFLDLLAIKGHTPLHLVRGSSQSVYVLDRGRLRPFASEKAFLGHGHSFSNVRTITDEMLETFPLGDPILELPPASPARRRVRRRKLVKGKGKNQGKRKRGIGSGRGKRHARKKGVVRRKRNSAGAAGRKRTDKRRA